MTKSGIPEQPVLILNELMGEHHITRGVFSTLAEIEAYVFRFRDYEPDDGEQMVLRPLTEDTTDPDEYATSEIVLVHPLRSSTELVTDLFVWSSEKKREVYTPWKLYHCTVDFGGESAFVVAHTVAEAGAIHTDNLGYDSCAELVMLLPPTLQSRELAIGPADLDLLAACGGRFLEDGTVEFGTLALGD